MLKIDLHIHTVASGHAFSTINEIATAASQKKMKVIGISDHGPSMPNSSINKHYFSVLATRIPKKLSGVRVLKGVEANITNKGGLDVEEDILKKLDYVMAAIHIEPYVNEGKKKNTKNVLKAMENKYLRILTHPYFDIDCEIDIEQIAETACRNNILLEVNASSFEKKVFIDNPRYKTNLKKMIMTVKKYNKKVIVNSDSHSEWEVGEDDNAKNYYKEIGLTKDLIINNYPKELEKILGVKF